MRSVAGDRQTGGMRPVDRPRMTSDALQAVLRHAEWQGLFGPLSWDPHDIWATATARRAKALFYRHKWLALPAVAPFVLLDTALPQSRALFWHRERFPIADAHYAMGFAALSGRMPEVLPRALTFVDALLEERCPGEAEYCWGYPFDWETCFGTWRAGTPLITSTPYGYEALEAAYEATGDSRYLAIMESVARFAMTRIGTTEVAPGVKASTYTPSDRRRVVNASAYRGFLLAAAGGRFAHPEWTQEARATLAFVLRVQRPDGSWLYAMDGKDAFVDNFHTCLVLKNVHKAWRILGDDQLRDAVRDGYAFYKSFLLDAGGLPLPFAKRQRPTLQLRDLYDFAEGLNLAQMLADVDPGASAIADGMVAEVLSTWVMPDGHFVTAKTLLGRNVVPYHRWAQAQMFRALACYAVSEKD